MATFESTTPSNRALATFNRMTPIQKIGIGAAGLTVIAGSLVFSRSGSGPEMAAMYTDLEARDAGLVADELVSRGVDYQLADAGKTVMVPRDQVYDLRIALSSQGLPATGEGYALLDKQGITTSEFRQRIDYQRALEGELSMTLRAIDGIEAATVHLALPEESVFVDQPTKPTASVLVRSADNSPIDSDQVNAMVHLVASSVKGMTPEGVTIADASGTVLASGGEASGSLASGSSRSDATTAYEQDIAASIKAMVGRVTGMDKVAVTVQAELDLTERQSTSERFDTSAEDTGVVVTERTANETYSGADAVASTGVLGPDGAATTPAATDAANSYSKDDAERTYAVNRTVESTSVAPGSVQRLNVAVLVDDATVSEEQRATIEQMVSTAAGVDTARGDQVMVTRLAFDTSAATAVDEAVALEQSVVAAKARNSMIRTGAIALVALIAMFLAYRSARRARREVSTPIDIGAIRAARTSDDGAIGALSQSGSGNSVSVASRAALDELSALADRKPEDVAQILQSWLAEEQVPT